MTDELNGLANIITSTAIRDRYAYLLTNSTHDHAVIRDISPSDLADGVVVEFDDNHPDFARSNDGVIRDPYMQDHARWCEVHQHHSNPCNCAIGDSP